MLLRLAVFSVSLAIAQATIPTPRAASNPKGGGGQSETSADKPPANSVSVICEQPASNPGKPEAPTKNEKDGWDKAAVISNYLLVVAGACGIFYAARTLGKLAEQTVEMRKVSDLENKTLILQYRPKIIVRNATAKGFSEDVREGIRIAENVRCIMDFQIVNLGGSPAHIVGGDIYLLSARNVDPKEEIELKESTHIGISERTLQPGQRESIEFRFDTGIPSDARWTEIYKGVSSHAIFLLGEIWYRDDLNIPRQTGIHRKLDPTTKRFEPKKDSEAEYTD